MQLKFHTNNLVIRICATILALGYASVGWFAIQMSSGAPTDVLADRAVWMGVTFVIAATLALGVSWLVADLSNIWCIPPRSSKLPRLDISDSATREPREPDDRKPGA
ncbi:MAG: hypothetical protein ACR2PA_00555 [Hyphomicrobiaceae bacterium]